MIDFAYQNLDRYTLSFEFEIGYGKEVFNATVPLDVPNTAQDYFSAVNSLRATPDDHIVVDILKQGLTGLVTQNSSNILSNQPFQGNLSSASNNECTSSAELYNFISTSSVRKNYYDRVLNHSPIYFTLVSAWNDLVSLANVKVSTGVVEASLFASTTLSRWDDGAQVQVVRRPGVPTFDIVTGSALDCNGNTIPTVLAELSDNYVFQGHEDFQQFQNYTSETWGGFVEFLNPEFRCRNVPIYTRCRKIGGNTYECIANVPSCQY